MRGFGPMVFKDGAAERIPFAGKDILPSHPLRGNVEATNAAEQASVSEHGIFFICYSFVGASAREKKASCELFPFHGAGAVPKGARLRGKLVFVGTARHRRAVRTKTQLAT